MADVDPISAGEYATAKLKNARRGRRPPHLQPVEQIHQTLTGTMTAPPLLAKVGAVSYS